MPLCEDPRNDLAYDSKDWERLLTLATEEDADLAWILHGFRCVGLRLHHDSQGYVLRPEFQDAKSSKWISQAQYEKDRDKWLKSHTENLIKLLDRLSEVTDP